MKTVLIATDFSKTSRNASLYGVEFANALNGRIILLHAYTVPSPIPGINISISRFDLMAQARKRLSDEAARFDNKKNMIETICDEGSAKDVILQIANEKKQIL
jgi:nucleotide-binding universal stress UspA family protein